MCVQFLSFCSSLSTESLTECRTLLFHGLESYPCQSSPTNILPDALLSLPISSICGMSHSSSHAELKLFCTKVANAALARMQAPSIIISLASPAIQILMMILPRARRTPTLTSTLAMAPVTTSLNRGGGPRRRRKRRSGARGRRNSGRRPRSSKRRMRSTSRTCIPGISCHPLPMEAMEAMGTTMPECHSPNKVRGCHDSVRLSNHLRFLSPCSHLYENLRHIHVQSSRYSAGCIPVLFSDI